MSQNIQQIFVANPITTNASTDLMYFGQSPYGAGNDAAMTFANFNAQIVANGTANQVGYYATTGNKISPITAANNGVLITSNTGIPSWLANSGTAGFVLTANTGAPPSWQADGYIANAVLLSPTGDQTITAHNLTLATGGIIATANSIVSGSLSGGFTGNIILYPTTTSKGLLQIFATNGGGNFNGLLTNAAITAARTWTLPDATGTIALVASSAQTFAGDSGSATPSAGTITFTGSTTGLTFTGSGSTMTLGGTLAVANGGTGITSFGAGVATWLGTPTSANLRTAVATTSTGTGSLVFHTSPTFVTPTLGAASATSLTFTSTTGIVGTTTNDNAAAGSVGEFVSSSILVGSAISITSTVVKDLTSISLTAGDWDVWGNIVFHPADTTTFTRGFAWVSSTSATLPDTSLVSGFDFGTTPIVASQSNFATNALTRRFSLSTTTTIYVSAYTVFGASTNTICGNIFARRRR